MGTDKISETIQRFDGLSYYRCGAYFQRNGVRLHRKVWEYHNGPIPDGYDVHHKDHDKSNNDISNLELMRREDHHHMHGKDPERIAVSRESIKKAMPAAAKWHSTPAGREWHSRHAIETARKMEPVKATCVECGKEYESKRPGKFCSNACKTRHRAKSGVDNEQRICPECGVEFTVNKYSKKTCCSYECARKRRWERES